MCLAYVWLHLMWLHSSFLQWFIKVGIKLIWNTLTQVFEREGLKSRDDQSYFKIVAKPQTLASSFITIFPQTIIRNVEWLFCRLFGKCKKSVHEVMSEFWLHMYLFNDLLEKTGNAYVLNAWICWTMWTWVLTEEVLKTFQFSFAALKRFQMNTISPCDLV